MKQKSSSRFTRPVTALATGLAVGSLLLAGCSADSSGPGEPAKSGTTQATTLKVAFTTNPQPTYVNTWYGPIAFGDEHGLKLTEDDFTVFDSHAVGAQALLSGSADILGGSFVASALLREQGQKLQVFCPFNNSDTMALAVRNGINAVDQLYDGSKNVATDSPGGAGAMVFNALLEALKAPGSVDDIPNPQILESSSLRANAFAAGQVDAAVIHIRQFDAAKGEAPDGKLLATLADDVDNFVMQAFVAQEEWLAKNKDTAVGFCASIIEGNRELKSDYDTFKKAVSEYVDELPDEEELRGIFEVIQRSDVWPSDGIPEEAITYTLGLAERSNVLAQPMSADDLVNREILDASVALADSRK